MTKVFEVLSEPEVNNSDTRSLDTWFRSKEIIFLHCKYCMVVEPLGIHCKKKDISHKIQNMSSSKHFVFGRSK